MEIRRLLTDDGERLRDIRLRALRDAPYAFSSSYEREAAYGPELWASGVAQSDGAQDGAVFVAVEDGRCLGMAGGFFPDERRDAATLWGMWVYPSARGRGLGRRLVEAVIAWARDRGVARVELAVADAEPSRPAAALYRELGFVATESASRWPPTRRWRRS